MENVQPKHSKGLSLRVVFLEHVFGDEKRTFNID